MLLPLDPDASAAALRDALQQRTGLRLGVIISDTAGRTWREGQTDQAIGAAGVEVARSYVGRPTRTATSCWSPAPPTPTNSPRPPTW